MSSDPSSWSSEDLIFMAKHEMEFILPADGHQIMLASTDLMVIIGVLQLACRHPKFAGASRERVDAFIREVVNGLAERQCVALVELIRRGGLREFDEREI